MQIVEHEKFSVKKMIFDPREISDTEKQRRGDILIHATPVDVAKDQIIKTENLSARKVAEQWWRKNIGSPLYYETEIGKVEINENSIQSSLAHRYGQAKLDAITSLKDGFNNAVYLWTIPDFVRTRDNVQNHYFAYPINYDGKRCYVFCRAMEDANKNSLYVHEVFVADNIQKEGNTLQTAAFKPHGGIALYKHILSDVLSAANVDNSSETSKQNGEKFSLRLQNAISEADTEPTEAQKKSGNYKKGHVKFGGYDYTIENPKGSYRSGVDENGKEWKQKMNDTYGYIRGKFGKDGDHLDMFINDNADLDNWNGDVFVVDQVNPDGKFDEHKVMYGYDSLEEAKKAYLSNYEKGWTGLGNITPVSKADFDKWLDKSNRKLKPFADYADITSKTDMDTAPSSFEEFLDVVRYSIRNEKERAAAEDAYNFAQENRPDRYSRYAIVNMEKPGAVPQYLEKKTAADNWRRYYNKLKWGNYKLFDLDKPFEDNVKNLVGKFPETFRQRNDDIRYSLKDKDRKQAQLDIILKTNPMLDDYHTGIRKVEDIKTLEESVGEARSEAEKYGDEEWSAYPDITNDMLQNALETGEITIYSSEPIKNGVFVTPSYMQASDYAGGGNVYEKTVPLTDVARINTDEGQYAKVDGERYSVKGVNAQSLFDAIHILYTKGKTIASQLFNMTYFDVAETHDFMKRLGMSGDKFTVRYGVLSRHFGKDGSHDFTEAEWNNLPEALKNPFAIAKLKDKKNAYRIYTSLKTGKGEYVVVGADVKNAGRNLEVNSIATIFGRRNNATLPANEELLYTSEKIAPEQKSLLSQPNSDQYPSNQELSVANVDNSSESAKNNEEKYSLKDTEYFKVVKDDDMEKEQKMTDDIRIYKNEGSKPYKQSSD